VKVVTHPGKPSPNPSTNLEGLGGITQVKKIVKSAALLASAGSIAALLLGNFTAEASAQQVTVRSNVYLISSPHLGASKLKLEPVGSRLTVDTGGNTYWYHVTDTSGRVGYVTTNPKWITAAPSGATTTQNYHLPPGVTIDPSIHPLANTADSSAQKAHAVLQIAEGKIGTPYIWGHNEDRGQYGFDCSNFVEYVYHHALGYVMSGSSQTQNQSVGWRESLANIQPGDLLIFNNGGHVGIYAGNGRVIQEGGGLGKVGYLKFTPGSYWYTHLTSVRRMF